MKERLRICAFLCIFVICDILVAFRVNIFGAQSGGILYFVGLICLLIGLGLAVSGAIKYCKNRKDGKK